MIDWPDGARDFVTAARVARLATSDASGIPHAVPICFAILGNSLYSVVDDKPKRRPVGLKRLRNIAVNPRVVVLIDEYHEDWARLRYALLRGIAELVEDPLERERAISALRDKYPQYQRMTLDPPTHPLIRVDVESVHHWRAAVGRE